jgi:hypothetical protein
MPFFVALIFDRAKVACAKKGCLSHFFSNLFQAARFPERRPSNRTASGIM